MKGISLKSFVILCTLLSLPVLKIAHAETAYSEFSKAHNTEKFELSENTEIVTHRFGEYQLVEILIRSSTAKVTVHDLRVKGLSFEAYEKIQTQDTIAIVSGGFFGFTGDGKETPIGLIRENSVRKTALMPWSHGGVLVSDGKGEIRIFPAESKAQAGRWAYAIQSKPIIILNGNVDVGRNLRDADFNRVAVGTAINGDILIVGLFHSFGQAATLVQFSRIYKQIADKRGVKILRALAMDGGSGAQVHIPKLDMHFGDTGLSYFPNAIRFDDQTGRSN